MCIKTLTSSSQEIKNIWSIVKGKFAFLLLKLTLGGSEYLFKYFYVIFWDSTSLASLKTCSGYKINIFYQKHFRLLMTQIFELKWYFLEYHSHKFHKTLTDIFLTIKIQIHEPTIHFKWHHIANIPIYYMNTI